MELVLPLMSAPRHHTAGYGFRASELTTRHSVYRKLRGFVFKPTVWNFG
jgi:hypothetical protein